MTGIGWCDSGHFFIITRFLFVGLSQLAIGPSAHAIGRYRSGNVAHRNPYQRNHVVLVCPLAGLDFAFVSAERDCYALVKYVWGSRQTCLG